DVEEVTANSLWQQKAPGRTRGLVNADSRSGGAVQLLQQVLLLGQDRLGQRAHRLGRTLLELGAGQLAGVLQQRGHGLLPLLVELGTARPGELLQLLLAQRRRRVGVAGRVLRGAAGLGAGSGSQPRLQLPHLALGLLLQLRSQRLELRALRVPVGQVGQLQELLVVAQQLVGELDVGRGVLTVLGLPLLALRLRGGRRRCAGRWRLVTGLFARRAARECETAGQHGADDRALPHVLPLHGVVVVPGRPCDLLADGLPDLFVRRLAVASAARASEWWRAEGLIRSVSFPSLAVTVFQLMTRVPTARRKNRMNTGLVSDGA